MLRASVAILASALLLGIYARGGFAVSLGFVALVPWLGSVATLPSWRAALASGIAMAMLFALAVFAWFGDAVAAYTGIGTAGGIALVVLAAPLMQPQVVAAALAARWAAGRLGPVLRAVAVAAAAPDHRACTRPYPASRAAASQVRPVRASSAQVPD